MAGLISIIFGGIELLLGLRFVLLLLGANPLAPFVSWIYDVSNPLVAPFAGILGRPTAVASGTVVHSIFDPSTLVAFVIFAAIGGILLNAFHHHRTT